MVARPYRGLFVTHDTGYYGAGRSLQTFLRSYPTKIAELLVTKWVTHTNDLAEIQRRFGPHVTRVRESYLPFDRCYQGKGPNSLRFQIRQALWHCARRRLLQEIAAERFDFVYLNSLVLHPMVEASLPFLIHVREIYDGTSPRALESLGKARGVIFIDEATRAPFADLAVPNIVLNNPLDLGSADHVAVAKLRAHLGLDGKTVFSMVGRLDENKGTAFVIDSFKRAGRPDALLVLVGEGEEDYVQHCKTLATGLKNIVFHGFDRDVATIYRATDYVVRAEAYPCIGRTIYEGLYAGCGVIVPGSRDDAARMFEYPRFRERVHAYPPRDAQTLADLFRSLPGYKERPAPSPSNVDEFIAKFDEFVRVVLARKRDSSTAAR